MTKPFIAHLPDQNSRVKPVRTPDGRYLRELKWQKVDEQWVLKHYGRPVLERLQKDGSYEDENKEIVIVKAERK